MVVASQLGRKPIVSLRNLVRCDEVADSGTVKKGLADMIRLLASVAQREHLDFVEGFYFLARIA